MTDQRSYHSILSKNLLFTDPPHTPKPHLYKYTLIWFWTLCKTGINNKLYLCNSAGLNELVRFRGFSAVHTEGRTEQVHGEIVQDKTSDIDNRY